MYYLLHRQKVPDKVTTPPEGLTDLMADITREVLRAQPSSHCLYKFIADYLDALLRVREKTMVAQSVIDELIQTSQNVSNFLQQSGICYDRANQAAEVIQKSFHDYVKIKRDNSTEELTEFKELELINELIKKCKFTEREIQRASPAIRKAFRQFISDYLNLMKATVYGASAVVPIVQFTFKATVQGNLDILNTSATLIQATFRGYRVRAHLRSKSLEFDIFITKVMKHPHVDKKRIKRAAPFDPLRYECIKDEMLYCKLHKAAEIIQRNFRRYHDKTIWNYAFSKRILDRAATTIEKSYKGYAARKEYKKKKKLVSFEQQFDTEDECQRKFYNNKATEIQKSYKGYSARKEYKKKKRIQEYEHQYKPEDQCLRKYYNKKATVIQSNYKGYRTRQHYKHGEEVIFKAPTVRNEFKKHKDSIDFQLEYELDDEEHRQFYNKKATKIQSNYKGYRTRKHFRNDHEKLYHHESVDSNEPVPATGQQVTLRDPFGESSTEAPATEGPKEE